MEWKEVRLESILALPSRNGLTKPSKIRGKGVKMIGMGELFANPIIYDIPMDRVPVTDKELSNSRIMPGDLLFARQSLTLEGAGKCCYVKEVKEETVFESHLIRIRIDNTKADAEFIYYFFNSFIGKCLIQNLVNQVAAAGIRGSELVKLDITIPKEVEDQRRIASILSSLDRKIELNNKINADLEEMAQAIFKNWFVDFEPFKDGKFVDSELGMIPEGWKVGTLKDLLYLRKDSIKAVNKGNLPYLPIDTIPMHCLVATDFKSNDEAKSSLQTFEQNDIVVGAMRVYFHRVILAPCKGITRTTCFVLSVKNENALAYSLMRCNQDEAISFAEKTSKGSTMPYAVWDGGYGEYKVVIPPDEVMKSFNDLLGNFFSKMNKNAIENSRLSLLRDTLLPRLMSGELEVPE